jgi:two-component system chemotaxis sensor kinase CheA
MDERLGEIFREESLERVERMSAVLLAAEAGAGDSETVAQLFRDAHSIKGSAGMFGLDEVGSLAGAMEDILASARDEGTLPAGAISALLGGTDAIRSAVGEDSSGVAPAFAALRALDGAGADDVVGPDVVGLPVGALPEAPGRDPVPQRMLRVRAEKVDRLLATVGETALHGRRLKHLAARRASVNEAVHEELQQGEALVSDLQDAVLGLRTLPLETIVGGLPRAVRDIAAEAGRDVRLELVGTDTPLDRTILDGIADTLVHLLRNAVSHGIEPPGERAAAGKPRTGTIRIHAEQRGGLVAVSCADDGRGVSPALLVRGRERGSLADVLAEAGFSTADGVSTLAGRGVGLDAVKSHVESLGGSVEVESEPGAGTTVTLLLPLTLAIVTVLLVERAGQVFGLPLTGVDQAVRDGRVHELHGTRTLELDGTTMPLADLADALRTDAPALPDGGPLVVVASGGRRAAVACDRLMGDRQAIVKPLGPLLAPVAGYLGATILDDGGIALLLDPAHLVRAAEAARSTQRPGASALRPAPMFLVVDDQFIVRELERTILEGAGYRVLTADDGRAALAALDDEPDVECVVSDVEMPGMDGLELLDAIRARPERAALPVVIVTSRDDVQSRARGAEAGADAWVIKSHFDQEALLDTVGRLVGLR